MENEVVLTTCPRDCYDTCGVAVVKRAGRSRTSVAIPTISSAAASYAPSAPSATTASGVTRERA